MDRKASLIEGDYKQQILKMSAGMIIGMLGMTIFNMVDAMYVGRLGEEELAALSFTFPVVMIVQSIALGLGVGMSAQLSRTLGQQRFHKAARVTTDGILLSLIIVILVGITGMLTITPLFTLLGATGRVLEYVEDYMSVWYISSMMVVVPMVGNNAIRATGDTRTPSMVMLISAGTNLILDPVFIFGFGAVPAMGVRGAAIATAIARSIGFLSALTILGKREKLLTLERPPLSEVLDSWKGIVQVALPTALVRMISPFAVGIITGLLARTSTAAVAGFGAGAKAEGLAMAFTFAVGSAIGPFIGQNSGAGKHDRVMKGAHYANRLAFISGTGVFLVLLVLAGPFSRLFSPVEEVQRYMALYLRLAGIGYGMQGLFLNSNTILNVLKKPLHAAAVSLTQMFVLYIPLAFLGARFFSVPGVFCAQAISYILIGLAANRLLHHLLVGTTETTG